MAKEALCERLLKDRETMEALEPAAKVQTVTELISSTPRKELAVLAEAFEAYKPLESCDLSIENLDGEEDLFYIIAQRALHIRNSLESMLDPEETKPYQILIGQSFLANQAYYHEFSQLCTDFINANYSAIKQRLVEATPIEYQGELVRNITIAFSGKFGDMGNLAKDLSTSFTVTSLANSGYSIFVQPPTPTHKKSDVNNSYALQ